MVKLLLSLLAIFVAIFIVLALFVNTQTKPQPIPTPTPKEETKVPKAASEVVVTITNAGFVPQTVRIKKGTQVTWTNTEKNPHWVASDPHPTHTGLPGFDSLSALTANDSYTYTFDKTGTFTYHDYLNPLKFKGTVIVE